MSVIEISAFGPPEVLQRQGTVFFAARAHALMESNQHVGKLVLSW